MSFTLSSNKQAFCFKNITLIDVPSAIYKSDSESVMYIRMERALNAEV